MSKLRPSEINFNDNEIVVEVETGQKLSQVLFVDEKKDNKEMEARNEATLILNRAREEAAEIFKKAEQEASELKERLKKELEEIELKKNEIIEKADIEAKEIIQKAVEDSKNDADELIKKLKEDIEIERVKTIENAYKEGYEDGLAHIQEELEAKISSFDKFCAQNYEVRDKILKSANKDIIDLILNIAKKILLKELDAKVIDKIIKNTVSLLEKKENITIILSLKYAKLLYEFQKQSLNEEIEFNFEDFKQYENFDIVYNSSFDDDTIIVENLKERFDASINSQLDVVIRNIYDNTQNGKIDLTNYENEIE